MPTPPYAKLRVHVNGGGPQTGEVVCAGGDVITFSAENNANWKSARWELWDFPAGFATPDGWTHDPLADVYYAIGTLPPLAITLDDASLRWGKYMPRLLINGATADRLAVDFAQDLISEDTGIVVPSPNLGLRGVGYRELNQFSKTRGVQRDLQADLVRLDGVTMGGGGGGGLTPGFPDHSVQARKPDGTFRGAAHTSISPDGELELGADREGGVATTGDLRLASNASIVARDLSDPDNPRNVPLISLYNEGPTEGAAVLIGGSDFDATDTPGFLFGISRLQTAFAVGSVERGGGYLELASGGTIPEVPKCSLVFAGPNLVVGDNGGDSVAVYGGMKDSLGAMWLRPQQHVPSGPPYDGCWFRSNASSHRPQVLLPEEDPVTDWHDLLAGQPALPDWSVQYRKTDGTQGGASHASITSDGYTAHGEDPATTGDDRFSASASVMVRSGAGDADLTVWNHFYGNWIYDLGNPDGVDNANTLIVGDATADRLALQSKYRFSYTGSGATTNDHGYFGAWSAGWFSENHPTSTGFYAGPNIWLRNEDASIAGDGDIDADPFSGAVGVLRIDGMTSALTDTSLLGQYCLIRCSPSTKKPQTIYNGGPGWQDLLCTPTNVGGGVGIIEDRVGDVVPVKSFIAGTNVDLDTETTPHAVIINCTAAEGATGPAGDPGPEGPPGAKGDKGDTGDAGPAGDSGPEGPAGEKGDTGDKGDPGDAGLKGDKGDIGPAGLDGAKGDKGDTGDTGPTGDVGPEGPEGPTGPEGPEGPAGSGEANTVTNVGGGAQLAKSKDGVNIPLRTLVGDGTNIDATVVGDTVQVSFIGSTGAGEANTASNLGVSGQGLFASKSGADLQFKRLKQTNPIGFSVSSTDITISIGGLTGFGTSLQVLRMNSGATAMEWATISGGGSSAGSSGQVQTSDGSSGFSAPTNVLAGANYLSVGSSPASSGFLRLPSVASQAVVAGSQVLLGADAGDGYLFTDSSGSNGMAHGYIEASATIAIRTSGTTQLQFTNGTPAKWTVNQSHGTGTQAGAGWLRFANSPGEIIAQRNSGNTANQVTIAADDTDLYIGSDDSSGSTFVNTHIAASADVTVSGTDIYVLGSGDVSLNGASAAIGAYGEECLKATHDTSTYLVQNRPAIGTLGSPWGAHGHHVFIADNNYSISVYQPADGDEGYEKLCRLSASGYLVVRAGSNSIAITSHGQVVTIGVTSVGIYISGAALSDIFDPGTGTSDMVSDVAMSKKIWIFPNAPGDGGGIGGGTGL